MSDKAMWSAEQSTLHDLECSTSDRCVFVGSNTEEGKFCAERLAAWSGKGEVRIIDELDLKPSEDRSQRALRSFANELASVFADAQRRPALPELVVTGGTKPQSALAAALGMFFGVPCHYRLDKDGPNFTLPRLPLKLDPQFIAETRSFWHWLEEEETVIYAELDERLRKFPPERRDELKAFVFEVDAGQWGLSPIGDALLGYLRQNERGEASQIRLAFSSLAREQWESPPDSRASEAMRRLADKVAVMSQNGGLQAKPKIPQSDLLFFPGGGKANAHVSLFIDEQGRPHICEFTFSHDERDRMLNGGLAMRARYSDFQDVACGQSCGVA